MKKRGRRKRRINGTSEKQQPLLRVKVRCPRCGAMIGPIPLDGKQYVCVKCQTRIFSNTEPSIEEEERAIRACAQPLDYTDLKEELKKLEDFSRRMDRSSNPEAIIEQQNLAPE